MAAHLDEILDQHQRCLLASVREVLGDVRAQLSEVGASAGDQEALARTTAQLDELFLLVVVGEFNAGKSALINALLGCELLEQGVTPTTSRIHWLRFGAEIGHHSLSAGLEQITAPVALLRETNIVDTPGTNAIDRHHETITGEFVPRADFVLFVTSADRPFTESERLFMERLRQWGKKIVLVVNKVDLLSEEEWEQVQRFVAGAARELLGAEPRIFPTSAKKALAERLGGGCHGDKSCHGVWQLESFLAEELDRSERFRSKLQSPLRVGRRLCAAQLEACEANIAVLAEDFATLDQLEGQLEVYRADMQRDFRYRLGAVEKELHELEQRGNDFFDDLLRLRRVPELLQRARVEQQFERRVVADGPQRIERAVADLIDWMLDAEHRQWSQLTEHVTRRRQHHADSLVGTVSALERSRDSLLEGLGRKARDAVASYDQRRESARLANSVQKAVAGAAMLEVGAVGLGGIVAVAAMGSSVDLTGVLAAGTLATLGLFVLPAKRRRARAQLRGRLAELRKLLLSGLEQEFEREIEGSLFRLRDAAAPYTRFVRAEKDSLEGRRNALVAAIDRLGALDAEIERC